MTQELNSSQKHELLNMILDYFKLHLHAFKHPQIVNRFKSSLQLI